MVKVGGVGLDSWLGWNRLEHRKEGEEGGGKVCDHNIRQLSLLSLSVLQFSIVVSRLLTQVKN